MFKEIIKEYVAFLLRLLGIPWILTQVLFRNKVTILVYHNPTAESFRKHVEYLSRRYNFISLGKLVNAIKCKDWLNIPLTSLVFTIDDGHKDNYKLLDIFSNYRINPTIYLCSHIVNTNRHFWWKTRYPRFQRLKRLPYNLMLNSLRHEVGYEPEKEYQDRQALNIPEIKEMSPYVDFGSHTMFHPILTNCTDEKRQQEIRESKNVLERLLNRPIEHFAFPNGDYGQSEVQFAINCGYRSARTLDFGWNDMSSDPYRLKVMEIQDNATINILCAQISVIFPLIRKLVSRIDHR